MIGTAAAVTADTHEREMGSDIASACKRLKQYRDRLASRTAARTGGQKGPQGHDGTSATGGTAQGNGTGGSGAAQGKGNGSDLSDIEPVLLRLVARALLEPDSVPLDVGSLHRKLCRGSEAHAYEAALVGLPPLHVGGVSGGGAASGMDGLGPGSSAAAAGSGGGGKHALEGLLLRMAAESPPLLEGDRSDGGAAGGSFIVLDVNVPLLRNLAGLSNGPSTQGGRPHAQLPGPPPPGSRPGSAANAFGSHPPPQLRMPPQLRPHQQQGPPFQGGGGRPGAMPAPPLGVPPELVFPPPIPGVRGVLGAPPGMMHMGVGGGGAGGGAGGGGPAAAAARAGRDVGGSTADLDNLLNRPTTREKKKTEKGEELLGLIQKPTARQAATQDRFKSEGGPAVREFCEHLTRDDCARATGSYGSSPYRCHKVHFRRLLFPWTMPSLGNCSYLDTCRHMKSCKYVHYELDPAEAEAERRRAAVAEAAAGGDAAAALAANVPRYLRALPEPQWLNCDVRTFDMSILGKFGVIMADPPWEIHQDLPYGTMSDDEMRNLNVGALQDEGVIFMWVTGRAMELGRECLELWGYSRVDELVWVKTNQLQRLIRTGRTGHWLNHSKEHCLIGVKGDPNINRHVDCDVIVAEVRETSRKPDEMYSLLERLSPGTRKLEIFARSHNRRPGWVSLGNQLPGTCVKEPEMRARYEARYGPLEEEGAMRRQ